MNGSSLCARRARARLEILKTPSPYSTEEVSSASSCQSLPPTHASFKTCAFTAPKKGRVRARGHHPNIEQLRNLQLNKYLFTDSGVSLAKMKQMADQRELYSDKDAAQHNTAGCHVRVCVCVWEAAPPPRAFLYVLFWWIPRCHVTAHSLWQDPNGRWSTWPPACACSRQGHPRAERPLLHPCSAFAWYYDAGVSFNVIGETIRARAAPPARRLSLTKLDPRVCLTVIPRPAAVVMRLSYANVANLHDYMEMQIRPAHVSWPQFARSSTQFCTMKFAKVLTNSSPRWARFPSVPWACWSPSATSWNGRSAKWQTGGGERNERLTKAHLPHPKYPIDSTYVAMENSVKHDRIGSAAWSRFCPISSGSGFIKLPRHQKPVAGCVRLVMKYEKPSIPRGQTGVHDGRPPSQLRAGSACSRAQTLAFSVCCPLITKMNSRSEARLQHAAHPWWLLTYMFNIVHRGLSV